VLNYKPLCCCCLVSVRDSRILFYCFIKLLKFSYFMILPKLSIIHYTSYWCSKWAQYDYDSADAFKIVTIEVVWHTNFLVDDNYGVTGKLAFLSFLLLSLVPTAFVNVQSETIGQKKLNRLHFPHKYSLLMRSINHVTGRKCLKSGDD